MTNSKKNQYIPDYLVTPGEILEDYLESLDMTQVDLATRTGMAKKTINEIIKGKSPITPETALKLERSLGRPAHFWNNLELQFQEDRIRLVEKQKLESSLEWLKKIPVKSMVEFGWIPKFEDKGELLEAVLCFFGIASPDQWPPVWGKFQIAYRQTQRFETLAESVSVWLRQGEIEAQQIACNPFDRKLFKETLHEIRGLTRESPQVFQPKLIALCAAAGVAVVFIPELPKTGVHGATRWIGNKAIIQLSLYYKSNDQLWFTFFHEAGHILIHGRKDIFIEGNGFNKEKEEEANIFARDKLIPPTSLKLFLAKSESRPTLPAIQAFAEQIDVAPGIVVGRLQHEKIVPFKIGNKLKVRYCWTNK